MPHTITFMPGSGGNFLARCLNLHPEIDWARPCVDLATEQRFQVLCYDQVLAQGWPDWRDWENGVPRVDVSERPRSLRLSHITDARDRDIVITTRTQDEWIWSLHQALYKNTVFHDIRYLTAGQRTEGARVLVPCHHLWHWDLLAKSLDELEHHMGVTRIDDCRAWQRRLWQQWCQTHAPSHDRRLIDRVLRGPTQRLPEHKRYAH